MRFLPACMLVVAAAAAGMAQDANLVANSGFEVAEDDATGWTQHYRRTVDWVLDDTVAHDGGRSARCHLDDRAERTGVSQRLNLNAEQATPLLVSLWYRTQDVTGVAHRSFAVVMGVEYMTDTLLDRMDDAFIFPFETGTRDWTKLTRMVVPQAPIRYISFHCEMKNRTGTAWFDDVSITALTQTPITGPVSGLTSLADEDLPNGLAEALDRAEAGEFALVVDQQHTQDYHTDELRTFVNGQPVASPVVAPLLWVSELVTERIEAPYVNLNFKRRWDDLRLDVDAQGREGQHLDVWVALPVGLYVARVEPEGWEPEFDAMRAGSARGRVVLHLSPEMAAGRDQMHLTLAEESAAAPAPAAAAIPPDAYRVATDDGLELVV